MFLTNPLSAFCWKLAAAFSPPATGEEVRSSQLPQLAVWFYFLLSKEPLILWNWLPSLLCAFFKWLFDVWLLLSFLRKHYFKEEKKSRNCSKGKCGFITFVEYKWFGLWWSFHNKNGAHEAFFLFKLLLILVKMFGGQTDDQEVWQTSVSPSVSNTQIDYCFKSVLGLMMHWGEFVRRKTV